MLDSTFFQACEAAAAQWEVPALAVGTSVDGRTETLAVGCDPGTIFQIASITKPLTATLALDLLDLEAPTGVWPADVRVRHLLSHTSGFDSEAGDFARFGDGDDALAAAVAALPSVRRWVPVEQVWSYANSGYWLAGWLSAERAGTTFEDALAKRVLSQLGLESTSFGEPELAGTGRDALEGPYPRARRPSGGLVSNVPDLLRVGESLLTSPAASHMRIVHGKPAAGVYGLGLFGERVGGVEVWGHSGSYGGFQSSLLVIPDRRAVFTGLTNSGVGSNALWEIEDAFFARVLGERRQVPERIALPAEARESFTGSFANSGGWYEVRLATRGLVAIIDGTAYPAEAIGEQTFEITDGDRIRGRFDFPREGFGRFGGRLAERIE